MAFVWLFAFLSGMIIGLTSRDVINKSFVRCLPGHPRVVRRVVFLPGLAVSLLAGALFMSHGGLTIQGSPVIFCAAVCLPMSVYLAGADVLLIPWAAEGPHVAVLLGFGFATTMFVGAFLHSRFTPMIIRHPLWVILGATLVGSAVWLQMGLRDWGRRLFSIGLRFNRPAATRELYRVLERRYAREATASAVADAAFVGRMRRCPDYSAGRYIWGTLYTRLGNLAAWWKWLVFAFVMATIVSLYAGWGNILVFMWVSWSVVPHSWPPLHSVMLVPAGRRERCLAIVSLAATITGVVALCAVVAFAVSVPLSRLIPEFEIWDIPLVCRPVPPATVAAPLIVVPLLAAFSVLLSQRLYFVAAMVILLLAQPFLIMLIVVMRWPWMLYDGVRLIGGPVLWIGVTIVFAWTLFVAACFYRTRNRSLVGS
jgi:hypothetical protein